MSEADLGNTLDILGPYLRLSPTEVKKLPKAKKVEVLRELRIRPIRCPRLVSMCCAELLLEGEGSGLGDEQWAMYEQGAWAALDCGQMDAAMAYFTKLKNQFSPKSTRVRKIAGMIREANSEYTKAIEIYDDILSVNPADPFVVKRKACIKKAQGDFVGAIAELEQTIQYEDQVGEQVEKFTYPQVHRGTDESVYRELFYLNYVLNQPKKCLFYSEELLLVEPMSYLNYIRLAETLYTLGQKERAANAYAQSLRLNDNGNSARAVYGLWLCASDLVAESGNPSSEADVVALADAKTLLGFATNKLKQLYSGSSRKPYLMLTLQRAEN